MELFSKKSKDQIKIFRLIDALTFGLAALVSNIIMGYFFFNAINIDLQGRALLVVTSLAFWLPYITLLWGRAKWIKRISFVTKHGIPVVTNDFPVKQEDVERITDETISLWDAILPAIHSAEAIQTLFIEFKTFPITERQDLSRKFAGLLKNKWALIGYKENLNETALSHELGHEIHYSFVGHYSNEGCHKFMQQHGLP